MLGEVDEELKSVMKSELRKNQQEPPSQLPRQATTARPQVNRQG